MLNIRLTLPVTPPGTMGTTKGGHVYAEVPDQSSMPAARMDGTTLMDGTTTLQGTWAPMDLGKIPYVSAEQPWVIEFGTEISNRQAHDIRVYVSSYSDAIDLPLVRYGETGATPSVVVIIPAQVSGKPNSGSNVTPLLVTGISGAVSAAVNVGGKLRRPIGITVDLSGLPTVRPAGWAFQLLGFVNGDLSTAPVLASGVLDDSYLAAGGLLPSGPDGITTPHTFGPEEPTVVTSITIYAVAGLIAPDRYVPGMAPHTPGAFQPNSIIPGITASCVVSIGTTSGVVDMRNAMLTSTSAEFHIDPSTGKFAMDGIDFSKAIAGTFTSEFSAPGGGVPLSMAIVDLFKATNFNAAEFEKAGGVLTVKALAADKLKTGILEVGGAISGGQRVSRLKVFDIASPTPNLIGWIGDDSGGSGYIGAWFKRVLIGGSSPATAQIVADASGNVAISGTLIAGNIAGKAANITGTLAASQIAAGTIAAAVSLTAPTLTITSGSVTIQINGTDYVKISNSATHRVTELVDGEIKIHTTTNSEMTRVAIGLIEVVNSVGASMQMTSGNILRNSVVVL